MSGPWHGRRITTRIVKNGEPHKQSHGCVRGSWWSHTRGVSLTLSAPGFWAPAGIPSGPAQSRARHPQDRVSRTCLRAPVFPEHRHTVQVLRLGIRSLLIPAFLFNFPLLGRLGTIAPKKATFKTWECGREQRSDPFQRLSFRPCVRGCRFFVPSPNATRTSQ